MRWAFALARARAGKSILARMAMMAMTTNNSIRVKAPIFLFLSFFIISFLFSHWSAHRISLCYPSSLDLHYFIADTVPSLAKLRTALFSRAFRRFFRRAPQFPSNCVNFSRKKREKNTPKLRAFAAFCVKFSLQHPPPRVHVPLPKSRSYLTLLRSARAQSVSALMRTYQKQQSELCVTWLACGLHS